MRYATNALYIERAGTIQRAGRAMCFLLILVFMHTGPGTRPVQAQGFVDQEKIAEVLNSYRTSLEDVQDVFFDYYVFGAQERNTVFARNRLYDELGDGDAERGRQRARLVSLLGRFYLQDLKPGDTLVVPTEFEVDFRAYSPFPHYYTGARHIDKLFVIHKNVQAWAAYEYGRLARWGPVNTGAKESPTPNGRFNFNWRQDERVSTLSPPGEEWLMTWVLNFHHARGIHIHQYSFPTGGPTSHGCVRMIDADARWVYEWADTWKTTAGDVGPWSANGRLIEQGTMVLVLGEDPVDVPRPFIFKKRYPILRRVELPEDPYSVAPGTPQQKKFDQLRPVARLNM